MDLNLFEYGLEFAKIFDYEITDFRKSGVNDRCAQNWRFQKSKIFANPKPSSKRPRGSYLIEENRG
jgi:hypothetical protein